MKRPYIHYINFVVYFGSVLINLVRYHAISGQLFSRKRRRGQKLFCIVCRKTDSVQSENFLDAHACFSSGTIPYFKEIYHM